MNIIKKSKNSSTDIAVSFYDKLRNGFISGGNKIAKCVEYFDLNQNFSELFYSILYSN